MASLGNIGNVNVSYEKDRSEAVKGLYHYAIFYLDNKYDRPIKVRIEVKLLKKGSVLGRKRFESPITDPGETSSARPYDANNKPLGIQKGGEMRLMAIQVLAEEDGGWDVIESKSYDDQVIMKRACYVATYAFSDEEHEEVEALRSFRDEVLMRYESGRWFINAYYNHQEQVSLLLGDSRAIRWLCRSTIYTFNRLSGAFLRRSNKS